MEIALLVSLGAILLLLLLSAFFSGSETALTAASDQRLHQLEKDGSKAAGVVNRLRHRRDQLIGAILIGNNLANILASSLATSLLITLVGDDTAVIYATVIMTSLVVVFSEVLPKLYAINHADRMSLFVAPAVRVVVLVFSPVSRLVIHFCSGVLHLFGGGGRADIHSEEHLLGAIELHGEHAQTEHAPQERAMLRSILDLDDVEVGEIMVHRTDVEMIDAGLPPDEIVAKVLASQYTRLPLYRDAPENVIGVLHAKALLRELRAHDDDPEELDPAGTAAAPWFVPEQTLLLDQLRAFQTRREHFALVVDEYGALMGIVTLEDILEEIVGEISDEHDVPVLGLRPQADGSYIVNGAVTIRDLNRELDWGLPDEEASTIAGLVLHEARLIPEVGRVFRFHDFRFEVLRRRGNQITSLRITPPPERPDSD
jgi:Mg2+/Co2+ transporter CorB